MRRAAVLALLLAACDEPKPPPPPPPAAPEIAALPELKNARAAWIDRQPYDSVPPPDDSALTWNLKAGVKHVYTIRQVVTSRDASHPADKPAIWLKSLVQAEGRLEVHGRAPEPGHAGYVLKKTRWEMGSESEPMQALPQDSIQQDPGVAVEYQMAPDGRLTQPRVPLNTFAPLLLDQLLVLPTRPVVGADVRRDLDVPAGRSYGLRGSVVTKMTGWHRVEGAVCARLESTLDLDLLLPEGSEGRGRLIGRLVAYFDPAEGRLQFLEGAAEYATRTRFRAPPAQGQPPVWGLGAQDVEVQLSLRRR